MADVRPLASELRRAEANSDKRLEDVLEGEAKAMLTITCEKMTERVARFKAITMFLAVKNKIGQPFGGELDEGDE